MTELAISFVLYSKFTYLDTIFVLSVIKARNIIFSIFPDIHIINFNIN